MDTTVVNCHSRVMKLVRDFDNVLVKLSMEGFDTDEPKLSQEWLINAIQPEALRDRVKEIMNMGENKKFKQNTKTFVIWLNLFLVSYGEFEPMVKSKPDKPKVDEKTPFVPKINPEKQKVR